MNTLVSKLYDYVNVVFQAEIKRRQEAENKRISKIFHEMMNKEIQKINQ